MRWQRIVAAMSLLWCVTIFGGDYTTRMAEAVQSITSISADPLLVQDSTPTTVTVTVAIAQDPGLIRNSVLLQQMDNQGKVIASKPLYDDGTHGDLHAGDSVFTTQLVLHEKAPKILQLRASAAYLKQVKRVSSPTLAITVSAAGMLPIFGPKQYTRTQGPPDNFTDAFQNCETAAQYKMVVTNGHADGTARVSSASIILNGTQVFGPSEITQQVGRVEKVVTVGHDNNLQVRLASAPGSSLTIDVECTAQCLNIGVTSPLEGSQIDAATTVVTGSGQSSADEVGLTVNEVTAQTLGGQFAAVGVPLAIGPNHLTVIATNACLNQAFTTIQVHATSPPTGSFGLLVSPPIGSTLLPVTLRLRPPPLADIAMIEWDFDGNGTVDASGPTVFSTEHTYETAGLFLPTVVVTRRDGTRVVVQSAVTVFSPGLLDTLLQNKCSTMTTALLQQDMEATLRVFALATRDTYRHTFSTLGANVPQWVANIRSLRLVEIRGRMAIYELTGLLNGVERSFSVTFIIDGDGIWRIRFI